MNTQQKQLDYFTELWTVNTNYFYYRPNKLENLEKITLEYKEVIPVYVFKKSFDYKGELTHDICPIDFSKKENEGKSWQWSLTVDNYLGKTYFFTEEEAIRKYNEIPLKERKKYEEIKKLKKLY
jgi:YHS domain-containing protein